MSALDPSAPGLPIVPSGGGASLPTTPASALLDAGSPLEVVILDVTGAGATVPFEDVATTGIAESLSGADEGDFIVTDGAGDVQRASVDAAAVRTVISAAAGAVIADPLTGADWTTTAATNTSATWTAGVSVTLTALSGATGRVEVQQAAVISSGAQQWDHCVRVDVTAGDTTSGTGFFVLIVRADASNFVYARLYQNGQIRLVYRTGGSEVISSDVAGPSAPQRTGGQLWLRLRGDVFGAWRAMWGVGSAGALPTAWTTAVSVTSADLGAAVPATSGVEMWVGSSGGTPLTATHTVEVLAIRDSWSGSL